MHNQMSDKMAIMPLLSYCAFIYIFISLSWGLGTNPSVKISFRGDANIKKMEFLHKDQLTSIHKDSLRMLRGIMHFREHMMVCFEKENLADQAQALQELGDIKDKVSVAMATK
jgi:hypothetical protein